MAKWFRSAEMEYVSLIVNEDAAHAAVNDLGMLGVIQFTDVSAYAGYMWGLVVVVALMGGGWVTRPRHPIRDMIDTPPPH